MMEPTGYSLRAVVTDGALTAPRWLQHVVKLMTHASLAFGLWCVSGAAFRSSAIAGPVLFLALVAYEAIWPTDRQPLTFWQHVADWITDGSLATAPLAGAVFAMGDRVDGVIMLAGCLAAYLAGHRNARP